MDKMAQSFDFSQRREGLWVTINKFCRIVLRILSRNMDKDHQILLDVLMIHFHREIFPQKGLKDSQEGFFPAESRYEFGRNGDSGVEVKASENIAMEYVQWKDNQKGVIKSTLEQVLVMLINYYKNRNTSSSRPQKSQHEQNTQITSILDFHLLNDDPIKNFLSSINTSQQSSPAPSLKLINREENRSQEQLLAVSDTNKLENLLELLRKERQMTNKSKQQKKRCSVELWSSYGLLLRLERQKFDQNLVFGRVQPVQQRLLKQLTIKNSLNANIISKYCKKIGSRTSQHKISKSPSQYHRKENIEDCISEDKPILFKDKREERTSVLVQKTNRLSWTRSNNFLKTNQSHKLYTIRSKPKLMPHTSSSLELKQTQMRAKVESSFKETKKVQSLGKNILNNIVFDPDSYLSSSKRRLLPRTSDKSLVRRFQKPLKTNRVLLRVGGIRLSLQDYPGQLKRTLKEND